MIKSMTGFGKGKLAFAGGHIKAEIKTFNHKFFELSAKLPEHLQSFEEQIKKNLRKKIRRGKCYLWIQYEKCDDATQDIALDENKLKRYYSLLKGIKKKFNLKDDITLAQLLTFPEIIKYKPRRENTALLWRSTSQVLDKALEGLLSMRQKEGRALCADVLMRVRLMEKSLHKIKAFLPQAIESYKEKMKQKLDKCLDKNNGRSDRLDTEVAIFAKNCDVSEELARMRAHLDNLKGMLKKSEETGKVLDFIAQEIHREINTVGAKSSDFKISKEVIFIKGEVEKIREQVQNIE